MSEPEIATKAPESDADEGGQQQQQQQEQRPPTQQSAPGLGEHCTSDRPLLSPDTEAAGTIGKLGDIDTYITKPASYPSVPAPLLLLLTGGTGIHSPNNQRQADKYASAGFVVIMPDQFGADPAPATSTITSLQASSSAAAAAPPAVATATATTTTTTTTTEAAGEETPTPPSLLESIKLKAVEAAKSFLIDMWLARQTPEKVLPRLRKVLGAAREEYADCLARSGGAIYAAGYCFGAKYVLILAGGDGDGDGDDNDDKETAGSSSSPSPPLPPLKAGAIAHGTLVTRADLKGIKAPVSIVAVENDPLFPDEILEIGRKHLAASAISHEVKVYPGVPHGFAVLGDYADPHIQAQQEKAFEQMLGWLKSH